MKVIFSSHALLMIRQRGLDKTKILETIHNSDFVIPAHNFREARFRLYRKNHLKVVIKLERDQLVVITSHWVAGAIDRC